MRDVAYRNTGKVSAVRGEGAGECQRTNKPCAHDVSVGLPRHCLNHQPEQDIPGIAVGPGGARSEQRCHTRHKAQEIFGEHRTFGLRNLCPGGAERRQIDMVG